MQRIVLLLLGLVPFMVLAGCSSKTEIYDPPPAYIPPEDAPGSEDYPAVPDGKPQKKEWPYGRLISLWNHDLSLDVSDLVAEMGVNCIWTSDDMSGSETLWEQSHLYRSSQVSGIDYVFAKINRAAWGWTHEGSLEHVEWVCRLALEHDEIIGLYLNDFYDEIEEGYRTEGQWREIISRAREVDPDLPIWVPVYPHRQQQDHTYDFDFDGVIVNMFGNRPEQIENLEEHIYESLEKFPDKWAIAGVYLSSGPEGEERWLTPDEYEYVLTFYKKLLDQDMIHGIRLFNAGLFLERPEYIDITRKVLFADD